MTDMMPEWPAPRPLELARETARLSPCGCGARPGYTCDGKGGLHLGRLAEAYRFGDYRRTDGSGARLAGDGFTNDTLIPAGAR